MPSWLEFVLISAAKSVVVIFILLTAVAYAVWLERKVVGRMQNRWGPTRVGPFGLLQPLADGLKFILKEDIVPTNVYKPLYIAAPMISVALALMSIAVVPFGENLRFGSFSTPAQITDVNIALLILLGVTSVAVYGVALAGWSSNSKYSLLGSLRASAQMVSYEASLGLSLIGVLLLSGSLSLRQIVNAQAGNYFGFLPRWNFFPQSIAFFVYLTAAFAETNRIPFDLPEAETELVAGYHTEYSSMKFAMFFMAEYTNMFTVACVGTLLFFGGWHGPVLGFLPAVVQSFVPLFWFALKVFFFLFLYIWIRGTLPRFRYDQLMAFGWKVLLPIALANIVFTSLFIGLTTK
jgi:NADH-quinone oxidoreductase subunit H